ncbi:MAG TPA: hypothetical protein VN843_01560 [Anaerolineales bacterium]|nr:hypothetical protein [Anaerolineales bacterium]
MTEEVIKVGSIVKVCLGQSSSVVKDARVLAFKPGTNNLLVETVDGSRMIDAIPADKLSSMYIMDSFCHLGPSGYNKDKAAKVLGYRGVKL